MSKKKLAAAPDVERVAVCNTREEALADLEPERAFDDPDRKQSRRKQEKRDPLGVHDFWDGYEQALKDVAYRADGTEYVGRDGRTLSQALHTADVRRKAQVAEAEADRAAGK